MQRLGPIGHHAKFFSGLHQRVPEGATLPGRHGNFIAEFTGETDPEDPRIEFADFPLGPLHERQRVG